MDVFNGFHQQMERFIREHCLHRVVKNDGEEIKKLLEQNCSVTEVRHKGNFVFDVSTQKLGSVLIWTEPADEEGGYVRITGYSIST